MRTIVVSALLCGSLSDAQTLAGYIPTSDVSTEASIDVTQRELSELVGQQTQAAFDEAKIVYDTSAWKNLSTDAGTSMRTVADPNEFYPDFGAYLEYYGSTEFGHDFVLNGFEGGATTSGLTGNFDFSLYDLDARSVVVEESTVNLISTLSILGELELAWETCELGGSIEDSLKSLDRGVAYYIGSLEGPDGSGDGQLLYAHADDTCQHFGTCSMPSGSSRVNMQVLRLFEIMQLDLQARDCDMALQSQQQVAHMIFIPFVQGTLWSAHQQAMPDNANDPVEQAKGILQVAVLLPLVYRCDQQESRSPGDARTLYDQMKPQALGDSMDFDAVREALERNYACLGITCDDIGGMGDGTTYVGGLCGQPAQEPTTEVTTTATPVMAPVETTDRQAFPAITVAPVDSPVMATLVAATPVAATPIAATPVAATPIATPVAAPVVPVAAVPIVVPPFSFPVVSPPVSDQEDEATAPVGVPVSFVNPGVWTIPTVGTWPSSSAPAAPTVGTWPSSSSAAPAAPTVGTWPSSSTPAPATPTESSTSTPVALPPTIAGGDDAPTAGSPVVVIATTFTLAPKWTPVAMPVAVGSPTTTSSTTDAPVVSKGISTTAPNVVSPPTLTAPSTSSSTAMPNSATAPVGDVAGSTLAPMAGAGTTMAPMGSSGGVMTPEADSGRTLAPVTSTDITMSPATSAEGSMAPASGMGESVAPAPNGDGNMAPATMIGGSMAPVVGTGTSGAPVVDRDGLMMPGDGGTDTSTPQDGVNSTAPGSPEEGINGTPTLGEGMNSTTTESPTTGTVGTMVPEGDNSTVTDTNIPGVAMNGTATPGEGTNGTVVPGSDTNVPGMGMNGTATPGEGTNGTSVPGSGTNETSAPEDGMDNTVTPGVGVNGTMLPEDGMNSTITGTMTPEDGMNSTATPGAGTNDTSVDPTDMTNNTTDTSTNGTMSETSTNTDRNATNATSPSDSPAMMPTPIDRGLNSTLSPTTAPESPDSAATTGNPISRRWGYLYALFTIFVLG